MPGDWDGLGSWIYESGVGKRSLGFGYKFGIIGDILNKRTKCV